jgi:hypothetical protein
MALVFPGKSKWEICDQVIHEDDAQLFPAFLGPAHPLHRFSDGVFHHACFDASPDRDEVNRLFTRFRELWDSLPRNLKTAEEIDAWGKDKFTEFE